jgi:hypothetical protein
MPSELMTARLRLRQWQPSDAVGHRSLWLNRTGFRGGSIFQREDGANGTLRKAVPRRAA